MATMAQVIANRQNAQLSTGPTSGEGKAASAQNASKHGLSSAFTVLAHENQDEFVSLLTDLRDEHQPATQHQGFLVDQLAKTHWLLARAQRLEALAFDHMAGNELDPADPDTNIINHMFKTNPNAWQALQRHGANAERSYYKAFRELQASKKLQNEAIFIAGVDSTNTLKRLIHAPVPTHPAFGPAPADTQYGHVPQLGSEVKEVRAAARAGDGSLCY
jgi:hypothetical protein